MLTELFIVSWNWGSGQPSGEVAEVKEKGEIAIESNRGNTIKKNAEPDNPAVHIERSGNDVVKRASELQIDKKAEGSSNGDSKQESKESESIEKQEKKDEEMKDAPASDEKEGQSEKSKSESKNDSKDDPEGDAAKSDDKSNEADAGDKREGAGAEASQHADKHK